MTSFGLIRTFVCVHVVFLLGVAGRNFGMSSSFCLTLPVASVPFSTMTALTYTKVHVAGYARSFPTQSEPQLSTATTIVTNTDSVVPSRPVATALADHPTAGIARPEEDTSSKIQAIFFGIAGTCIGVASLAVALLTLRAMSKQRQPDAEMSPPGGEDCPTPGDMELTQHPSSTISEQTLELNTTQPAENEQYERSATPASALA